MVSCTTHLAPEIASGSGRVTVATKMTWTRVVGRTVWWGGRKAGQGLDQGWRNVKVRKGVGSSSSSSTDSSSPSPLFSSKSLSFVQVDLLGKGRLTSRLSLGMPGHRLQFTIDTNASAGVSEVGFSYKSPSFNCQGLPSKGSIHYLCS